MIVGMNFLALSINGEISFTKIVNQVVNMGPMMSVKMGWVPIHEGSNFT